MTLSWEAIEANTRPGQWSTIEKLLKDGDPGAEILRVSITGDLARAVELLGADSSLTSVQRETSWTPLRLAAEYGHRELAAALIDHGARLDVPATGFEDLPLHLAAGRGHSEVISLLIERGADPNAIDVNRETALHYALGPDGGDAETVRCLLQGGAHPDVRDAYDQIALQNAASDGKVQIVKALLDFGADVNARPAGRASSWHEDPGVWPLLDDSDNARPLYGAVCSGCTELVDVLLNAGADINALSFGWSALHAAVVKPNALMVELLLERGADLFVKSGDGRTPIEMLAGFRRSAELLRAQAAARAF